MTIELEALQIHDGTETQDCDNFKILLSMMSEKLTKLSLSSVDGLTLDLFNILGARFKFLETLELFQCLGPRTGGILDDDITFNHLKTLIIDDVNFVESAFLEILAKCPKLTSLTYSGQVQAKSIYAAASHNPFLKSLSIQDIQVEENDYLDFEDFCRRHSLLEEVYLSTPHGLYYPKEYLLAMGKYLPRLKTLFIDSLDVDDEFLNVILEGKHFQKVQITSCPTISTTGFDSIFSCLDKNASLEFSRCLQFSDSVLKSLALVKDISSLRLFGTVISFSVLKDSVKSQKRLQVLHISNSYSQDEIKRLTAVMPKNGKIKLSISKMFD